MEEQKHQTSIFLNILQQLQEEMVRIRRDNERLMQEQEKILKILSDKKNQEMEHPSVDRGMQEGDEQQTRDNTTDKVERIPSQRSNKNKNYNEAESDNLSD